MEETEKIRLDRSSFFNRLGCSFHCEDHVHVQIFSTVQNMIHFIHVYFNGQSVANKLIIAEKTRTVKLL